MLKSRLTPDISARYFPNMLVWHKYFDPIHFRPCRAIKQKKKENESTSRSTSGRVIQVQEVWDFHRQNKAVD